MDLVVFEKNYTVSIHHTYLLINFNNSLLILTLRIIKFY